MDISAIASIASSSAALAALNPAAGGTSSATGSTPAQRKKAAAQFEAIMLRQLLGPSLSAMMGGEDSPAGSVYGYMVTDVFSQKLAEAGGMGLGKMLERQFTPPGAAAPAAKPATGNPNLPPAA